MSDKPVVLVAEDDPSVRMAIELVLKLEGFEVLFARDGEQALRVARDTKPDCILLDQVMPKMGGREVLGALKSNESTSDIPVLVLSGLVNDGKDEWQGADFVGKPFSPDELIQRIRTIVSDL
jgi:DNA-binding response OmpR family regulator